MFFFQMVLKGKVAVRGEEVQAGLALGLGRFPGGG